MQIAADPGLASSWSTSLVVFYALCFQLQSPLEPFLVEKLVGKDKSSDASVSYGRLQSLFSGIQMFASLLFGHILDKFGVRVGFTLNFLALCGNLLLALHHFQHDNAIHVQDPWHRHGRFPLRSDSCESAHQGRP